MSQAQGNAEVVGLLEKALELAKSGKYGHCALTLCGHPPEGVRAVYGGATRLLKTSHEAIGKLGAMMDAAILNCTLPEPDPALGADYACYNVTTAPLSYDFLSWLIDAEMTRVREGAPAPLKVAFWCGRDGKTGLDMPSRRQMLENVLRPMLPLIGAVEDEAALLGRRKDYYALRDVVAAARRGEVVPRLRPSATASAQVAQFAGWVTITLRESRSDKDPERNSSLQDWLRFAKWLKYRGELVVLVRDTACAWETVRGYTICPQASINLDARVALYAAAKCNLFVSNGPQSLALFMDAPWLAFFEPDPEGAGTMNTPAFWAEHLVPVGEQFPWCRPDQRLTWKADRYENLVAEWDRA